jgi:hypothetical protein
MQLEQLIKNTTVTNHEYRLVFLASKEHSDNSYVVTAFDKYRVQFAAVPRPAEIRQYMLSHLKTRQSPVAADPDQCRVRIVKSRQSGNGKSLVARRLSGRNIQRGILQLHEDDVCFSRIVSTWLRQMKKNGDLAVLHLDLTPAIRRGRSDLIFSLTVLNGLVDSSGKVWLTPKDVYVTIELTISEDLVKKVMFHLILHGHLISLCVMNAGG